MSLFCDICSILFLFLHPVTITTSNRMEETPVIRVCSRDQALFLVLLLVSLKFGAEGNSVEVVPGDDPVIGNVDV